MLTRRAVLPVVFLCFLLVPTAYAFTIDGPINWVASHGGNVRFNTAFTATQYQLINGLTHFTRLIWNGNMEAMGFDCDTGVNMTIINIGLRSVKYNVSSAGVATTYVYSSQNKHAPEGTNTDNIAFDPITGTSTITTTGNVVVTLDYASLPSLLEENVEIYIAFFPLMVLLFSFELRHHGIINNKLFIYILVIAALATLIRLFRG